MTPLASYNRICNFTHDLMTNKNIELKGEYELQKLRKSLDILKQHINTFQEVINTLDYHCIEKGPNEEPFFFIISKEKKEENDVIELDDIEKLPDFNNIFDDFKISEEIDENSKEDIKKKKSFKK